MVVYLDEYRKAKQAASAVRCENELMCVNWTPVAGVSAMFCYQRPDEFSPNFPDDLASIDTDAFVSRVYALASQI